MKIIIASNNPHKVAEYRLLFRKTSLEVLAMSDIGVSITADESGSTYEQNAAIKAEALKGLTNCLVIADDSGLEIASLHNFPGLESARFAERCGGHHNAIQEILKKLENHGDRKARFVCVIALCNCKESTILFRGECDGRILEREEGSKGFGYDPVFFSDEADASFATLTDEQKNRFSHRGRAVQMLIAYLREQKVIETVFA
ncbi:MAG: RdgB/HAM1 family non-canonical purine NTP pyrophosphatase [Bacilli bacterium]|jgi:XTP/dITP diphosphohydrolase